MTKRKDIPSEDKWRLEDIFPTDEAFKTSLSNVDKKLADLATYEGQLTQNSSDLLTFLKAQDDFWVEVNKLYVYAHMRLHEDGNQSFYQDLSQKSEMFSIKASSTMAFVQPELSTLTPEQLETFYTQTPALLHYKRYFDELMRQKAHILDPATEALLAEVGNLPLVLLKTPSQC